MIAFGSKIRLSRLHFGLLQTDDVGIRLGKKVGKALAKASAKAVDVP